MDEIEIALLGFIKDEPKHGYDLHKEISDLSGIGIVWRVKMGKLYAMLHKMEANQWLVTTITQEGNRPQRNQFHITKAGQKVFDQWMDSSVNKGRDFRIIFLLKMYFAQQSSKDKAMHLIDIQRKACQEWLAAFNQQLTEKTGYPPDFNQIVINFRTTQINGYIEWLNWCEKHIGVE